MKSPTLADLAQKGDELVLLIELETGHQFQGLKESPHFKLFKKSLDYANRVLAGIEPDSEAGVVPEKK